MLYQLSYFREFSPQERGVLIFQNQFSSGAKNGTRTRDPNLGKVMLYQLSYFRISVAKLDKISRYANLFNKIFIQKCNLHMRGSLYEGQQ